MVGPLHRRDFLAGASNLQLVGTGTLTLLVHDTTVMPTTSVPAGLHRIQVDYLPGTSPLALQASPAGTGTFATVTAGLGPRYGLVTSTVTEDTTTGSPPVVVTTAYGGTGAPDPATGLAVSVTNDPGTGTHANLTTATGLMRRSGPCAPSPRPCPPAPITTTAYYGATEGGPSVCGPGPSTSTRGAWPSWSRPPAPTGAPPRGGPRPWSMTPPGGPSPPIRTTTTGPAPPTTPGAGSPPRWPSPPSPLPCPPRPAR